MSFTGKTSPWGKIQSNREFIPGFNWIITASHGGVKLNRTRNSQVPDYMRIKGGWYEEDEAWAIPFVVFEIELMREAWDKVQLTINRHHHTNILRNWFPEMYERYNGVTLKPGESFVRDEQNWKLLNANKMQTLCAISSDFYPSMVEVTACIGGREEGRITNPEHHYLVPIADYKLRGPHGFAFDPAAYKEIDYATVTNQS